MVIYLKRLTDDLLEVCRMLDDMPGVKVKLAEIAFDVSVLPDVAYGVDKDIIEIPAERLDVLE